MSLFIVINMDKIGLEYDQSKFSIYGLYDESKHPWASIKKHLKRLKNNDKPKSLEISQVQKVESVCKFVAPRQNLTFILKSFDIIDMSTHSI